MNKIGDEGTIMLSESLKTNTTLTSLDLNCDENGIMKQNRINEEIIIGKKWKFKMTYEHKQWPVLEQKEQEC